MIEVLLVDDESYVTASLVKTIPWLKLGVENVYEANSAMMAMQILEQHSIDILVTDIRMPEMSGLELIEVVKEKWPNVRSLLLTGYSDFEYAKRALHLKAVDFLLKPVNDELFTRSMLEHIEALQKEWQKVEEYQGLLYAAKSDHQLLQRKLMEELLLGRQYTENALSQKLAQYHIDIQYGQSCLMLTIQLSGRFSEMESESIRLIEYAAGNIAEEVFAAPYKVWHNSAPHECLVILLALPEEASAQLYGKENIKSLCKLFQQQVSTYLKGSISIVISNWFEFPESLHQIYREALSALYRTRLYGTDVVFMDFMEEEPLPINLAIEELLSPPTFVHLLETGQYEYAQEKLKSIFNDASFETVTREQLYELFIAITNGVIYVAHRKGIDIRKLDPSSFSMLFDRGLYRAGSNLKEWALEVIDRLQEQLDDHEHYHKNHIIKQVQELVTRELGIETSVKTIADRVYLHPVYLSKIYKGETGESLGDYIIRMRMERAVHMLKFTNKKIYEITAELGYQNPQYFSKIFKKFYGCTPNEYRDQ